LSGVDDGIEDIFDVPPANNKFLAFETNNPPFSVNVRQKIKKNVDKDV
jgi:hypothetical protein